MSESLSYLKIDLDPGLAELFGGLELAQISWALKMGSEEAQALLADPWVTKCYPDASPSFLQEQLFGGLINFPGLFNGDERRQEGELDVSLSMCRIDDQPVDPRQFMTLDMHYGLRALVRDEGSGFLDRVWLHNQLDDPWLRPTEVTSQQYAECAYSVRGLMGWPLALLGSEQSREAIRRILPRCFPSAVPDPLLFDA